MKTLIVRGGLSKDTRKARPKEKEEAQTLIQWFLEAWDVGEGGTHYATEKGQSCCSLLHGLSVQVGI